LVYLVNAGWTDVYLRAMPLVDFMDIYNGQVDLDEAKAKAQEEANRKSRSKR
jgi:hypothetical protein